MTRAAIDVQTFDPVPSSELTGAVDELRHLAHQLDTRLPDPADGEAWARFDQALGDLHRALVLLGDLVQRAEPYGGVPWAGTISLADGPPVRTS